MQMGEGKGDWIRRVKGGENRRESELGEPLRGEGRRRQHSNWGNLEEQGGGHKACMHSAAGRSKVRDAKIQIKEGKSTVGGGKLSIGIQMNRQTVCLVLACFCFFWGGGLVQL